MKKEGKFLLPSQNSFFLGLGRKKEGKRSRMATLFRIAPPHNNRIK